MTQRVERANLTSTYPLPPHQLNRRPPKGFERLRLDIEQIRFALILLIVLIIGTMFVWNRHAHITGRQELPYP